MYQSFFILSSSSYSEIWKSPLVKKISIREKAKIRMLLEDNFYNLRDCYLHNKTILVIWIFPKFVFIAL